MLTLSIQHLIHLTREQRYALHEGKEQNVIGVSVPVWFMTKTSSEPGKEVFCEYHLTNPRKETPISNTDKGYEIPLPYRIGTNSDIDDEQWREFNLHDPAKLDQIYENIIPEMSSKNLLDPPDGGSGSLTYRENARLVQSDSELTILHHVTIAPVESLLSSLD